MIMLIMLEDLAQMVRELEILIFKIGLDFGNWARMHVRQIGFNHESLLEMPKK